MEKINIAEILRNCPKGMELYSPIFGKVYLDKIRPHLAIVVTTDKEQGDFKEEFLYDGRYGINGECMLFPSKGKTTWEGFVPPCKFKKESEDEKVRKWLITQLELKSDVNNPRDLELMILKSITWLEKQGKQKTIWHNEDEEPQRGRLILLIMRSGNAIVAKIIEPNHTFSHGERWAYIDDLLEKQSEHPIYNVPSREVILAIWDLGNEWKELTNGCISTEHGTQLDYIQKHWEESEYFLREKKNEQKPTDKVEPKFKVGDRIQHKNGYSLDVSILKINADCYTVKDFIGDQITIDFTHQDNYELVHNKFDINTLTPFESRVLIRNCKDQYWVPAFWGYKTKDCYVTTFGHSNYCIPYEGNEHLLGKTDDCANFYKTWE